MPDLSFYTIIAGFLTVSSNDRHRKMDLSTQFEDSLPGFPVSHYIVNTWSNARRFSPEQTVTAVGEADSDGCFLPGRHLAARSGD